MFMGFGLIITILVIVAIVYALSGKLSLQDNSPFVTSSNMTSPLDIAKKRYARGEINQEEYEQIRNSLIS
jgi:putative membrane protein